jgi:hypothetical protein
MLKWGKIQRALISYWPCLFVFLSKFNFIRRCKGVQPKYQGSIQEVQPIREKRKNTNLQN